VSSTTGRFVAVLVALLVIGAGPAYAATPQQDMASANALVQRALAAARAKDLATAKTAYDQYENTWFDIEDGVRAASRDAYVAIERAMTAVSNALAATPADAAQVVTALTALDQQQQRFIGGQPSNTTSTTSTTSSAEPAAKPGMIGVLDLLSDAQAALAKDDYATASARLTVFEKAWLDVEGEVKTSSADDYRQTEIDMALAASLAGQRSPETAAVVNRMAARLEPYQTAQQYGIFDATIILLREGLEALLIIVTVSAILKRSASRSGQTWLWTGALVGLLLSVVLGLAIQAFFGVVANPSNRELMEGVIGLFAAAMLVYVSYWLHSKASLGGWQRYINQHTSQALTGGRLFGIAALAFLAVFREGAETALFYLGMVGNISNRDLLIGLGLGFVALAALGFLMVVVGLRIPMRPFFAIASLLVFYLCFKFIGTGIHALQVSGVIPTGSASYLPTVDAVGLYPTWPTTIAQLILLIAAGAVVLRERLFNKNSAGRSSAMISAALLLVLSACTSAQPSAPPTQAVSAILPAAPVLQSSRKEISLVAGPRRRLEELAAALQKGDIAAARGALEAYDAEWNGVEVYVNVRSRALYGEIETHYQADISTALEGQKPDAGQILPLVKSMVEQYDEAIKLCDAGPPLSPLFDDLATMRTVRAPLRGVSPALTSGEASKASQGFADFKARWPQAQAVLTARSADALQEASTTLAAADKVMSAPALNAAEAAPVVDALLERFNYGVNLLNAAARNADVHRTTFSTDEVQSAAALGKLQKDLRDSLAAWESGNRTAASEIARMAASERFDAVSAALQAKAGSDAAVKKALDGYAAVADQGSDAVQARAANKTAIEAIAIGQQALVGQFWTDAAFSKAYQVALGLN
jgi:high-affinity iron transporter